MISDKGMFRLKAAHQKAQMPKVAMAIRELDKSLKIFRSGDLMADCTLAHLEYIEALEMNVMMTFAIATKYINPGMRGDIERGTSTLHYGMNKFIRRMCDDCNN